MKYLSTRKNLNSISDTDSGPGIDLDDAILQGLADDGGLYLPEEIDPIDLELFSEEDSFAQTCQILFGQIAPELYDSVFDVFDFPVELKPFDEYTSILELFHGPTAAFKDFGARVLASALGRISKEKDINPTVLVATSGDTGGAVASAFDNIAGVKVVILFPKGGVSPRQEIQLGCWGDNVSALRVNASFDDCQALVKRAFITPALREKHKLTSANSINIARVLGQVSYYAWASLQMPNSNYVIPTGNLGNAFACVWAKKLGFPIRNIRLATNANQTLKQYFETGNYEPRDSISTLANAMDVGAPSNFERLVNWLPTVDDMKAFGIDVQMVDDEKIEATIKNTAFAICPHTACALSVVDEKDTIVVSTAHPAKFDTIVEPLRNEEVAMPNSIASLLNRETKFVDIPNSFEALNDFLNR